MKKPLILYSLIILTFLLSSCQKDGDNTIAPPITAENTFSCKINGEVFKPENHGGFIDQYGYIISILEDNSWIITLSDEETTLYLFIKNVDRIGEYPVHQSDGDQFFVQDSNTALELRDIVNDTEYVSLQNSGKIQVLSFEEGKKLILKFEEIILEQKNNSSKKIILLDGKLNINKETLNKDE